ncbi:TPA: hypothetical protein ACTC39_001238, partial [Neisseria meningitidis]
MPSETSPFPSFPQPFVIPMIPATFRHSRENGNLEPLNFQIIFEYCRCPKVWIPTTFRHSRENGNLEPQTF